MLRLGKPVLPSPEATEALKKTFQDAVAQPERQKQTDQVIQELESHRKHNGFASIVAQAYSAQKGRS